MALIKCPECGKEISDQAASCPTCGFPINPQVIANPINQSPSQIKSDDTLKCPKCGSSQLTSNKKGFSGGKAVAGAVLTGGIGILAGTIGSGKVVITCLKCGYKFKAGEYASEIRKFAERKKQAINSSETSNIPSIILLLVFGIGGAIVTYNLFASEWYFFGFIFSLITLFCAVMLVAFLFFDNTPKKQL